MIRNYLIIAWRSIRKNQLHSFINIIGLAVGLAACLTIFAFVRYELSFDKHLPDSDRIYRLALNRVYPDRNVEWAGIPPAVAPEVAQQLPEIENFTRIITDNIMIGGSEDRIVEEKFSAVDSGFFDLFGVTPVKGSLKDFFSSKGGVILTETAATRHFGDSDPLGQTLFTEEQGFKDRIVMAIVPDPLPTSHFIYSTIVSLNSIEFEGDVLQDWGSYFFYHSYFRVTPDTDIREFENKIQEIADENLGGVFDDGTQYQAWLDEGHRFEYFLQPITDIHLHSNLRMEHGSNSSITYIYLFSCVAIVTLLIATINFINLATAKASRRTREVGIRKTVGARKQQLIIQFLIEATLISLISLAIALPAIQLAIPFFNQITGKSISLDFLMTPEYLLLLSFTPLFLGLLAGSYPAFYISGFRPSLAIKKGNGLRGAPRIRQAMVTGQFIIAIFLIAGTITIFRQMNYFSQKPLGFNQEQAIVIKNTHLLEDKLEFFRNEVSQIEGITSISFSSEMLGHISWADTYRPPHNEHKWVNLNLIVCDKDYLNTLDIPLIAGRNFRAEELDANQEQFGKAILNEAAVRFMGWTPNEAVGQIILGRNGEEHTVVGVSTDFNFVSLHESVGPALILGVEDSRISNIAYIRTSTGDSQEAIAKISGLWQNLVPNRIFEYQYLDESLGELYDAERLTGELFLVFSGLAIFLCCLGLFGLMAFLTEQRSKEIGVRKVMGAKISQIMLLLSKDFLRLVVIATLIAAPLSWYAISTWLENFAYSVDNSIWVLVLAGMLATAISWLTVSYVAYRSAKANPAHSLRNE